MGIRAVSGMVMVALVYSSMGTAGSVNPLISKQGSNIDISYESENGEGHDMRPWAIASNIHVVVTGGKITSSSKGQARIVNFCDGVPPIIAAIADLTAQYDYATESVMLEGVANAPCATLLSTGPEGDHVSNCHQQIAVVIDGEWQIDSYKAEWKISDQEKHNFDFKF